MILGWFLCFKIALKTRSLTFSIFVLRCLYSGIFKFFTVFEKKLLNTSAVSDSLLRSYPFSLRFTFYILIRKVRFDSLPKNFVMSHSSHLNFHSKSFWFSSKEQHIYFFVEYIGNDFRLFYL